MNKIFNFIFTFVLLFSFFGLSGVSALDDSETAYCFEKNMTFESCYLFWNEINQIKIPTNITKIKYQNVTEYIKENCTYDIDDMKFSQIFDLEPICSKISLLFDGDYFKEENSSQIVSIDCSKFEDENEELQNAWEKCEEDLEKKSQNTLSIIIILIVFFGVVLGLVFYFKNKKYSHLISNLNIPQSPQFYDRGASTSKGASQREAPPYFQNVFNIPKDRALIKNSSMDVNYDQDSSSEENLETKQSQEGFDKFVGGENEGEVNFK